MQKKNFFKKKYKFQQTKKKGWDYESIVPYFKKAEKITFKSDSDVRGTTGLATITKKKNYSPAIHAFVKAAQSAGFPYNDDYNSRNQVFFCFFFQSTNCLTCCMICWKFNCLVFA